MSRPDKEAYLNRHKGQRRRALKFPEEELSTEEEIIEYFNKCKEAVDTILVKEHCEDEFKKYIDPLSYDLYQKTKRDAIVDKGDYKTIDEDKHIEIFKDELIKATHDYFSKKSNKTEAFTKDNRVIIARPYDKNNRNITDNKDIKFVRSFDKNGAVFTDSYKQSLVFNNEDSAKKAASFIGKQYPSRFLSVIPVEDVKSMVKESINIEELEKENGMAWAQLPDRYRSFVNEYVEDLNIEDFEDLEGKDLFKQAKQEDIIDEDEDSSYDDWYISYADYILQKTKSSIKNESILNEDKQGSNKYKITYYLNTAAAERRPETQEDVDNDWKEEERYYPTDLEAFEYVYKDLLGNDEQDLYDEYDNLLDPNDDLLKIYRLKELFDEQDITDGSTIILDIEGPGQDYHYGMTKDDFIITESNKIVESVDQNYFDKFDKIIDKYLFDSNEDETMASQIVSAINKLIYKWYNDGDVYDNTYHIHGWMNDLSDYANWLYGCANAQGTSNVKDILKKIFVAENDGDYEEILKELADTCLNEEYLSNFERRPAFSSIYNCKGPFKFDEGEDDDYEDDDWEE